MSAVAEQAIYTRLAADSAVAALVSGRIYPNAAPQSLAANSDGTIPAHGVYQRISAAHEHQMLGASGMVTTRVQIDWYASTFATAVAIGEAARNALDGYRGYVSVGTSLVKIGRCHLDSDQSSFDQPVDASHRGVHRIIQDYMVAIEETPPSFGIQ